MDNHLPSQEQPLKTEFIRIAVDLKTTGAGLRDQIETQLGAYGEPLRWAITSVNGATAHVEAVVTLGDR